VCTAVNIMRGGALAVLSHRLEVSLGAPLTKHYDTRKVGDAGGELRRAAPARGVVYGNNNTL